MNTVLVHPRGECPGGNRVCVDQDRVARNERVDDRGKALHPVRSIVNPSLAEPVTNGSSLNLDAVKERPLTRGKTASKLGVVSAALFLASLRWAHHWSPLTVAIVAGWALATIAALVSSVWSLSTTQDSRTFAKAGLFLTLPSVLAVTLGGMASAAGADVSDACGGG